MEIIPQISRTSSRAMDNLRLTIHENELLNHLAHRVQSSIAHFFHSQENLAQLYSVSLAKGL